jgi:hypothetical protein
MHDQAMSRHRFKQVTLATLILLLAASAACAWAASGDVLKSEAGTFRVQVLSEILPLPLNLMHTWIVSIETSGGEPVADARLELAGGMPIHDHGLPTAPQVRETAKAGKYRIEGLRFHMQGDWVLWLTIRYQGREDRVRIPVQL